VFRGYRPCFVSVVDFSVKTAEVDGNAFVVSLTGEVDLHTAPELEGALDGVMALGCTSAVVDLADVSFIDSTTLAVLLRSHARLSELGGRLVLVASDRRILRTLELTGLDRVLPIERTLAEGVAAILD
jgi:anti-sigma B factor antagonist